jgi:Tfp pilus assembly protein PilF
VPPEPAGSATAITPAAPSAAEPLYHDGMARLDAGDTTAALATLRRAVQADPDFAPSYRALGLLYAKLGDKPSEKAQFVKYLHLAPSAADASRIRDKLAGL